MSDDSDLRDFLRAEGLGHGSGLLQAVDDPLLAEAGEQALAALFARRQAAHQRRLLAGVFAAAAICVGLAAGAAGVLDDSVSPAAPTVAAPSPAGPSATVAESLLAPLAFTALADPAGPVLEQLAQVSSEYSGYAAGPRRSVPTWSSWYEWTASSPQQGRLVEVTPDGDDTQVQTFRMPAPADGRVELASRGPLDASTTVAVDLSAETAVTEALAGSGEAGCPGEQATCAEGAPLSAASATGSPAMRALAALPGVKAMGTATDRLGRPAVGFTADLGGAQRIVVLADPDTGAFLGAEWIADQPAPHVTRIVVATEPRD